MRTISDSEVLGRLRRVLNRPIRVMGRFVQTLPSNWKLYVENSKDTYHASCCISSSPPSASTA